MRQITLILFFCTLVLSAELLAQYKKFGDGGIVRIDSLSKQYTTCQVYKDTSANNHLILTDLKVLIAADSKNPVTALEQGDILFFENGNPLSNKSALVIRGNTTEAEAGTLIGLKRLFETTEGKNKLTPEQLENLLLRATTWISNNKTGGK